MGNKTELDYAGGLSLCVFFSEISDRFVLSSGMKEKSASETRFFDSVFINIAFYWTHLSLLAVLGPFKCIAGSFKNVSFIKFLTRHQPAYFNSLRYHFAFLTFRATHWVFARDNTPNFKRIEPFQN